MTTVTRVIIPRLSKRDGAKLATATAQPSLFDAPMPDDQRARLQAIADDPNQRDARRIWARQLLAMKAK